MGDGLGTDGRAVNSDTKKSELAGIAAQRYALTCRRGTHLIELIIYFYFCISGARHP